MNKDYSERLLGQIKESIKSDSSTVEKGRAFLEWILLNVFDKIESEIEDADINNTEGVMICDGYDDKGIDAAFISNDSLYILQTKYNTSHSKNEVYTFIAQMKKIIKGQVDSTNSKIDTICDLIFDDESLVNEILFFYITENEIPQNAFENEVKEFEEQMPEYCSKSCRMKIMGINEIVDYRSETANTIPKKFIGKKTSIILENYFQNKQQDTIVAEVTLKSVAQLVKNNKEYLFYSNIRNFLNSTKINKKMKETFINTSTNFWHYNNGITIVCDDYNEKTSGVIEMITPQIVNGCQTANVIFKEWDALKKDKEKQNSIQGTILVKIITDKNKTRRQDITRYTNSQNAVQGKDFFALDSFHRTLKKDFAKMGYNYEIQRNADIPKELKSKIKGNPKYNYLFDKMFKNKIFAKEAVQAYASGILLHPAKAKSIGSFLPGGEYYDRTFNDKTPTDPRIYIFPFGIMYYGKNILNHKKDPKQKASNLFFISIYFRLINRILYKANVFSEDTYCFLSIANSIEILDKIFCNEKLNVRLIQLANEILYDQIYDDTGIKDMIGDNMPSFLKNKIEQERCVNIINEKIDNRLTKQNTQELQSLVSDLF